MIHKPLSYITYVPASKLDHIDEAQTPLDAMRKSQIGKKRHLITLAEREFSFDTIPVVIFARRTIIKVLSSLSPKPPICVDLVRTSHTFSEFSFRCLRSTTRSQRP